MMLSNLSGAWSIATNSGRGALLPDPSRKFSVAIIAPLRNSALPPQTRDRNRRLNL